MPKGSPNPQTLASMKYQKKAGITTKSFKVKKDVADEFTKTCEKLGISQAEVITKFMKEFIEKN